MPAVSCFVSCPRTIPKHVVTEGWVIKVKQAIKSVQDKPCNLQEIQQPSELLLECIILRFDAHAAANVQKIGSWVSKFCRLNLSLVCSIIVMSGFSKSQIGGRRGVFTSELIARPKEVQSLLLMDVDCSAFTDLAANRGACAVHDSYNDNWIRSGKVSGKFSKRLQEHKQCSVMDSTTTKDETKFYQQYCSIEASEELKSVAMAYFEQLKAYGGLVMDPSNYNLVAEVEDGMFVLPPEGKQSFSQIKNKQLKREKFMVLIEYLFELVFELMLHKEKNASTSIGFERYLLNKQAH